METVILTVIGVLIFVVGIMVSVGAHEAGHMVAAKLFKLSVPQFFIGFGPKIFSFKKGGTEYGARWIPLGGFVRIEDQSAFSMKNSENFDNISEERKREIEEEQEEDSLLLRHVAPWKRQIIYIAGPAVNIVIGTVILFVMLLTTPLHIPTNTVDTVNSCTTESVCGAEKSGILPGDTVLTVDGKKVRTYDRLYPYIGDANEVDLTVLRDGREILVEDVPIVDQRIGVQMASEERDRGVVGSIAGVGTVYKKQVEGLLRLPQAFTGAIKSAISDERDPSAPTSVVGMGTIYGDVASTDRLENSEKVFNMVYYMAMINLALGAINIVPCLPLDGGRMLIAAIDSFKIFLSKIRRTSYVPLSSRVVSKATIVMFIPVAIFMVSAILADIRNPISIF